MEASKGTGMVWRFVNLSLVLLVSCSGASYQVQATPSGILVPAAPTPTALVLAVDSAALPSEGPYAVALEPIRLPAEIRENTVWIVGSTLTLKQGQKILAPRNTVA